jgi:hypothetical protein
MYVLFLKITEYEYILVKFVRFFSLHEMAFWSKKQKFSQKLYDIFINIKKAYNEISSVFRETTWI